ncbi:unnamed protein product [Paramecium octaurelia]|uniref:Uncharacterized protein n=1 Tax=Paramecium octaurelia TaxID=43137 RepID=A0A8S1UPE5_PAROT|nr:unnamed protein product [Paramecium octaurelia]
MKHSRDQFLVDQDRIKSLKIYIQKNSKLSLLTKIIIELSKLNNTFKPIQSKSPKILCRMLNYFKHLMLLKRSQIYLSSQSYSTIQFI